MSDLNEYWPKSVAHLRAPYDNQASDHVVIAEINEAIQNGYKGVRLVRTALIPVGLVDEILNSPGCIGHEVCSWGPRPCVDEGKIYDTSFWIDGRKGRDERFQTIINSWNHHDREVLLPDNVMLMTYGLVPRQLNDGSVSWDDPGGPVYDVLRVKSHVNFGEKKGNPLGFITIRRDYLEDYCHLKGCAAVAVYYEERYSADDETFAAVLKGQQGAEFELPGRLLGMALFDDEYHVGAPQMSKVWGSRLILIPSRRPITDAKDPELSWPGHDGPMTLRRAAQEWLYGYVRDDVLQDYQSRTEFRIHPESGGVSYGGWWGTDRTRRFGRHHIKVELKKLYEGCPPHVIAHWHRFAVSEEIAKQDREHHGDRNIAIRAKGLVLAYLELLKSLARFSDAIDLGQTQGEIGGLDSDEVAYRGWSTFEVAQPLFFVVPLASSRDQFLARAVDIFKLFELLKPGPLRAVVLQLGLKKEQVKDFGSLKLLASLCQLASIARADGLSLSVDDDVVVPRWKPEVELPELCSLFGLHGLRVIQAHTASRERDLKIADAAGKFGIDVAATASGWGFAIDALYDRLEMDLIAIAKLIVDVE